MSNDLLQSKVRRLFTFLLKFAQIKAPNCLRVAEQHFHFPLFNLPHHQSVTFTPNCADIGETVLRVEKPQILPIPLPPVSFKRWLQEGWDDHKHLPRVSKKLISEKSQDIEYDVYELFESDSKRVQEFLDWQKKREVWAEEAKRAHLAKNLFDSLYKQFSHLNRNSDTYELLIGDGVLHWQIDAVGIHYPLILKRVRLDFDVARSTFSLINTDRSPELYFSLLAGLEKVDIDLLRRRHAEFETSPHHPLSEGASSFMKVLIASISPTEGQFFDAPARNEKKKPCMWREPYLFVAKKGLGFVSCIEKILKKIEHQKEFSPAICSIVGMPTSKSMHGHRKVAESLDPGLLVPIANNDVYLCKPANKEQIRIASCLNKSSLVHVQGPPGTGKSYTIANLIGHLLAQGKRVLVTSHTEQALKVLKEKIPEDLQSLCVPTYQSEIGDFKDLEQVVQTIVRRSSHDDPEELAKRCRSANNRRDQLIGRFKGLWAVQRSALASEYERIECGGEKIAPSEAAFYLRNRQEDKSQNWIPDHIKLTDICPITDEEFISLYKSNSQITKEEEAEISLELPDLKLLPSPKDFAVMVTEYSQLIAPNQESSDQANFWIHSVGSSASLEKAATQLFSQFHLRPIAHDWQMHAIIAGRAGQENRMLWDTLCTRIENAQQIAYRLALSKFLRPRIDENQDLEEALEICREICLYLDTGKTFGMFTLVMKSKWKQIINACSVNAKSPSKSQHFQVLCLWAEQNLARQKISELWDYCIARWGGPAFAELGDDPESICRNYVEEIHHFLNWHKVIWAPNLAELSNQGLNWAQLVSQVIKPDSPIAEYLIIKEIMAERFTQVIGAEISLRRERELKEEFARLSNYLRKNRGDIGRYLLSALENKDTQNYERWHTYLLKLVQLQPLHTWRQGVISKIAAVMPHWAKALCDRISPHGENAVPGQLHLAWKWKKLDCEIRRRQSLDFRIIQGELADCRNQMHKETLALVDSSAWHRQLTLFEQQPKLLHVLKGLTATFKKIKSTKLPVLRSRLQAAIQKKFAACLEAVPVWIMSISRLVEVLDPAQVQFDVVIIDEASQANLMGLIPLYMSKEVIVVGDDQQTSPESVGSKTVTLAELIAMYLYDIPYSHLYGRDLSIYELTKIFFGETIMLEEHFRSVPAIIEYCNRLSYDGRIQPLREAGSSNLQPATRAICVEGGQKKPGRKINLEEARVIVEQILEMTNDDLYRDKSIGVISLLGEEQARHIDDILRSKLSIGEYRKRSISCGTPPQFQGDERDIIFLTLVDGPGEEMDDGKQMALKRTGADDKWKKRFNVAVSRARDQLIVVHSVDPHIHLKPDDLRKGLILHALDPFASDKRITNELSKCESKFEKLVSLHLTKRGFKVDAQKKVGNYRIDLVVHGTDSRLAVECDGWQHDRLENKMADLERQADLERLGWTFERIRGTSFFGGPDLAMKPIYERLESMGIKPHTFQNNGNQD